MGQPGQRLLTAAENVWIVSCSGYNAHSLLFFKSTKDVLARRECGILQTRYPLWSTVRLSLV
jgi:hypothetical protein